MHKYIMVLAALSLHHTVPFNFVRRTSAAKTTNDSGTSIQGRNAAASCKPIYTGIHLRRTICVSKEAMERLPLYYPEGSLMACPQPYRSLIMPAQHFEPGDFTFHNRFGRAASQEVGGVVQGFVYFYNISGVETPSCVKKQGGSEEREVQPYEPFIDHTKQSWYFSNASSALTSDAELNRSIGSDLYICIHIYFLYLPICNWYKFQIEK
ncbi:Hypothetical_protein [Hexamita inflata]|uniref:Hypothetical_protein n=1 Tax=Hexamita inflata TaxID=28002 RepID=A0ABP1H9G2_9EUKA